jgi:hypothetical protein
MSTKPFDDTFKDVLELSPAGWAERLLGGPVTSADFIDADVATVTAAADKVLRVQRPGGALLLNPEAWSGHAGTAPGQAHLYSTLLTNRHELPVRSVIILLRPEANATNLTGVMELRELPEDPEPYLVFRYRVVRLWQEPLAPFLSGPAAMLPFAPLTDEGGRDLPATVERVVRRIRAETSPEVAGTMEAATFVLLGLRHEADVLPRASEEIKEMEESTTYQWIIRKGEARGALQSLQQTLLQLGARKFKATAPEGVRVAIEAITDTERLTALTLRILDVGSWDDLLAG